MTPKKKPDWTRIETEYTTGTGSYRALQNKYKVSMTALSRQAKAGNWASKRKHFRYKLATKKADRVLEIKVLDKNAFDARASRVADEALDVIEASIRKARKAGMLNVKGMRDTIDLLLKAVEAKYKILGVPARSEIKAQVESEPSPEFMEILRETMATPERRAALAEKLVPVRKPGGGAD